LKAALSAGDFGQAAREAHSIRGAAANFGASELAGLAASLEKKAEEQNGGRCRELMDKIGGEFERVKNFLAGKKVERG
ncbi:MAG: Hpt domain-containing protein, partial [candidate division Zixibacteria bacterium]|nr:Hpt domain-containing protein [candidate division Zixibacteria bacterium]